MTRWSLCLAEITLYAVLAGLVIAMAFDARARWKELLEDQGEPDDDEHDQREGAEVSVARPTDDEASDDTDPPPAA